jgi:Ni/Co efflux regulator RcnB
MEEFTMLKHILAAAVATALITAPLALAFAQATTEKSDKKEKTAAKKSERKLTAQQQKMKDCAPKWADYKKEKKVKGRAEYRKFMSTCLKG